MIKFSAIRRIYKLNIPNVFTTPVNISIPRIVSCHLRWIATVIPGTKFLLSLAYLIEHKSAIKIERWIEEKCKHILANIDYRQVNETELINKTIWTCWWQGEESAPGVVRECIERMRKMSNVARVVVLDETNYNDYVSLPKDIVDLYKTGKMSMAHFSDILRCGLLSKRGGLWIDSTIWVHQPISEKAFMDRLYSINFTASPIIKADWGYENIIFFMCIMGGRNRYFYTLIYDMLVQIWRVQSNVINYLIFDKVVRVIYNAVPEYKKDIDIDIDIDELEITSGEAKYKLRDVISEKEFDKFMKSRRYTKLTYKFNYPVELSGQRTLYGRILNT